MCRSVKYRLIQKISRKLHNNLRNNLESEASSSEGHIRENVTVASTMGPGVKVDPSTVAVAR